MADPLVETWQIIALVKLDKKVAYGLWEWGSR